MCSDVLKCVEMYWNVLRCIEMCSDVLKCAELLFKISFYSAEQTVEVGQHWRVVIEFWRPIDQLFVTLHSEFLFGSMIGQFSLICLTQERDVGHQHQHCVQVNKFGHQHQHCVQVQAGHQSQHSSSSTLCSVSKINIDKVRQTQPLGSLKRLLSLIPFFPRLL